MKKKISEDNTKSKENKISAQMKPVDFEGNGNSLC